MEWIAQNWIILALGLIVVIAALLLLGRSGGARTQIGQDLPPVVTGPAATPIDVPPAVIIPEPEALVEPIQMTAAGPPDELTRMKGVGPKVATLLNGLGITRYDQIAAWSEADIARVDAQLGAFKGRIGRDQWVEQARLLNADDRAGYEAKFGKLG